MALLYFGFKQNKIWAQILFPILILFTRIDTVIFLGIVFLVDIIWNKKVRWFYILGGMLGVAVLMSFNWFYFGELVNNTIVPGQVLTNEEMTGLVDGLFAVATPNYTPDGKTVLSVINEDDLEKLFK
jgi:hypothetical protein